ncbi:MAG: papain-like cysteine protease family protein [Phascolarctobacterium sp.]|nr:papain-like cysteine protease family protein [Phascolarctobacterium sp.]
MLKKFLGILVCVGVLCVGCYNYQDLLFPVKEGEPQPETGPDTLVGKIDVKNSPYFTAPDFYNMKSGGSLILLEKFTTHQQRSGYTCGPAAASMVIEHFTKKREDEFAMGKIMGTNNTNGTTVKGMVKYFEEIGWDVKSSESKSAPNTYEDFLKFVDENLQNNTPIIVENVDWGGHYRVIIGHDSMATEFSGDDVLIMADPFDTCDHVQDGYVVQHAEKFYYMWFDHQLFAKNKQDKPYLIVRPK